MQSLNTGEPISVQQSGPFTRAMAQWATRLAGEASPQGAKTAAAGPKRRFLFGFSQ
jgi:septum formation inhibitor-activating ATPase MinD